MTKQGGKSHKTRSDRSVKKAHFFSIRWRFITPLFFAMLVVAMSGAYILASNLSGGVEVSQQNVLLQSSRAVAERISQLYTYHRQEAQRVAFTIGVPEAARDHRPEALRPMLESLVRINGLNSIIVTDATGREVLGLQRVELGEQVDFALSGDTDLSGEPIIQAVIDDAFVGATGFLRTPGGIMLYTGVPIRFGDQLVGVVLVGQTLDAVLDDLKSSAVADLTLYGPDGALLQTTLPPSADRRSLALSQEVFTQALLAVQQVPVRDMQIEGIPYQGAYQPFSFGPSILGVVGAVMPDNIPYVTETGRQLTAMLAAVLAGVVVIVAFAGINRIAGKAQKVAHVAAELSVGQAAARTNMSPVDEISAIGFALDQYAHHTQEKHDALQQALRRQRREANHLMAVLESLPDGVVVQGLDGRVVIMNEYARVLLGSQRVFRSSGLHEVAALVTEKLGPALAPGLYTLGDPHRIRLDERMLSAQAAAVLSSSDQRLGTVILLRDITDQVRLESERDAMLQRLAQDIQQPLAGLGRLGTTSKSDMVNAFAREVSRQAVALQKMIVDMRELDNVDVLSVKRRQRPLSLETLVWAVANEWRQIAQANNLMLHVILERKGLFVLGDEKRLRWAVGNVIDNAIKYTLPGGALTLEINREADGQANLRVRDNGVGIAKEERQYVFTRFYRGNPVTLEGQVIRVPGMGQGLHIAKRIFESHGGNIRIKSTQGVGTAVYLSLPLTSALTMELPQFEADMDGETVQLPENFIIDIDRHN